MTTRLFEHLFDVTEKSLDYRIKRQNVLSGNIANIDTPGFTPLDISFEEQLADMLNQEQGSNKVDMRQTDQQHLSLADSETDPDGELFFDPSTSPNNDKNSVDIDQEMSKLAMNALLYNAQTTVISKKLSLLKYAATDGSR